MKFCLTLLLSALFCTALLAQAPVGFKFQAVARDAASEPLAAQNIGVRVSLLSGSETGSVVYSERHAIATSDLGVFDLQVGSGDVLSGDMEAIDWGGDSYYLKIDLDPDGGSDYVNMGATQLVSVPYALFAAESAGDSDSQELSLSGTTLSIQGGNAVDLAPLQDGVTDADADPANELQTLSLSGNDLNLSNGGGAVDLSPLVTEQLWQTTGGTGDIVYTNGSVGISVPEPEAGMEFHLGGDIFLQSNLGAFMIGYPDNGNRWRIATQNSGANLLFRSKPLGQSAYSSRFAFTQDGKLTVNGTATPGRLSVFQGGQAVGNGLVFDDGTANDPWHITHGFGLRFHYGNTLKGVISANNGAYIQGSDRKLKQDIRPLGSVTDRVRQLRPTSYSYRRDAKARATFGFIAQDVLPVFPELVHYVDADETYGLDYSGFGVIAIRAIQEQQEMIDAQAQEIAQLSERLARLERLIAEGGN